MTCVRVVLVSFAEAEQEIRAVRDKVFGEEQEVPASINWDGCDADCRHVVVWNRPDVVIATGRIAPDGKIGRLSVLRRFRREGVGRKMLNKLILAAGELRLSEVFLHAQKGAVGFYEREGFESIGPIFLEAGIEHVRMSRNL